MNKDIHNHDNDEVYEKMEKLFQLLHALQSYTLELEEYLEELCEEYSIQKRKLSELEAKKKRICEAYHTYENVFHLPLQERAFSGFAEGDDPLSEEDEEQIGEDEWL